MLEKERIIECLNTLYEHKMARDIFVPVLEKMGIKGVKFTGGTDEHGVDIEYYELRDLIKISSPSSFSGAVHNSSRL